MSFFDTARQAADNLVRTRIEPHVNTVIEASNTQLDEVAAWWKVYRSKNPNTDSAVLKIGDTLDDVQKKLGDLSDHISGAKVLDQANALIEQQRKYNNVLATRLAEALDEIKALKGRVDRLEKSDDCR